MTGRQEDTQKLVNQEARATLGAFRTTNQGALGSEPGLRPAAAQMDNRLRRFALRLASLPGGDQAGELIGASESALGQRLHSYLGCWNGREETVLLEVASPLEAAVTIEKEAAAANEAKRTGRPGLTISTRTDPAWRMERPAARSPGRTGSAGKATKSTWAGGRKRTTPNAQPSPGPSRRQPPGATRSGLSRSSRTRRRPSRE